jgi:hypothetical protein
LEYWNIGAGAVTHFTHHSIVPPFHSPDEGVPMFYGKTAAKVLAVFGLTVALVFILRPG